MNVNVTPTSTSGPFTSGPPSGREKERRAIRRYCDTRHTQAPDIEARDRVVCAYQGLAYSLAARFAQRGEDLDDLNQVALVGLLKAISRFDPDRGIELTTFATTTILGELKRHLRDYSWSVRLPRRVHDLYLRAQESIDELSQELGRGPTLTEIRERLDATMEDVVEALDAGGFRHNASLDVVIAARDNHARSNPLADRDGQLVEVDERLTLSPLLSRLPDRQQQIVTLRFTFGYSQTQIASLVGVSQMQVSRLLSRGLARLRALAAEPRSAGPLELATDPGEKVTQVARQCLAGQALARAAAPR